jgi:hypothetical protein
MAMEVLSPALAITVSLAVFTLLAKHALDMRAKQNYREMWGSLSLSLMPAALFWLWVASGELSLVARTLYLMPAGAIVGACVAAWAGYVLHDLRGLATPPSSVTQIIPPSTSIRKAFSETQSSKFANK